MAGIPPVPLTLEGSSVLHQFFRFDWKAWRRTPLPDRERIAAAAARLLGDLERATGEALVERRRRRDPREEGEGAVLKLHDDAFEGAEGGRDFDQLQLHGLVRAKHCAGGNAKEEGVSDLAGGAGDSNFDGLVHKLLG